MRSIATWLTVGFLGLLIFGVLGEWLVRVADDKGLYNNAGQNWDRAMSLATPFLNNLYHFMTSIIVIAVGITITIFTIVIWIDRIIQKRNSNLEIDKEKFDPKNAINVPEFVEDQISYPYKKALLKLDVIEPIQFRDDGRTIRVECGLVLYNKHQEKLRKCSIFITSITGPDGEIKVNDLIKTLGQSGNEPGFFDCPYPQIFRKICIERDMADEISSPPFLFRLLKEDFPLIENSRYFVSMELRSMYRYPTLATIQIDVAEGPDIQLMVLEQHI